MSTQRSQPTSVPLCPGPTPRQTLTLKAMAHGTGPLPPWGQNRPREASAHPLSLLPEPCAPMMEPQESSIRYSRWENSHPDEVHVASGPSTEEASGWQR